MATKAELLAEAKELGLELTESSTNAEIQEAIDNRKAENESADVTPAEEAEKTPEEIEAEEKAAKEAAEAQAKADAEQKAAEEEQARLEADAKAPKSEGSEIASAIREGLSAGKEDKRIKITTDKRVRSQFTMVRNKQTGEIMLRENATGVLSKVQLKSIEEKERDLQKQEIEEI